ncbi:flagellar hook-associated protein 1 FlgK [Roseibium hamelinense]|uniref:Flagellar hook-associated protein 1 n=1 Tax=Roseibium hamelinense TaxID=150831 RepID=A0A562THR5_9HYPH|nr:flagellar hook-associated protein FlgK [Roseibium hamelinense]MTI45912.1 flagellar hook-associated protein FlgK [Roseibium hamelinense]TWI92903.1 flagellar hook-associated protein 1 FlgK [Roseibium hamelinense]
MSLSVALQVAQSALSARQTETSTVSRNIAGAQEPGFSRKSVMLSTIVTNSGQSGGLRVDGIARVTDSALYNSLRMSSATGMSQQSVLDGLTKLAETVGDTALEMSPVAQLGNLKQSIQAFSSKPNDTILATDFLRTANDMAAALNDASTLVQSTRADADRDIDASVKEVNKLLAQLETLNNTIVKGTQSGQDVTDALDSRDKVLLSLSEEMGIKTLNRADGDIVVYTDGGVTLFETTAREVSFAPTPTFDASTTGAAVFVDGVPVAGPGAVMPLKSGRIHGLAQVRDDFAVTYQSQLDEIARGLITAFAEADQLGGGGPDQTGLFSYGGSPAVPAASTLVPGIASQISVNPAVDPDQGGNLDLLRNGGINGAAYDYNPTNLGGFNGRLNEFLTEIDAQRNFDGTVGLDPTDSLTGFGASSVSWLESLRKSTTSDVEVQSIIVTRTAESLSNNTGVNIDEEMTLLLDIERAYGAAAKLITAVDKMLDDLLAAAR